MKNLISFLYKIYSKVILLIVGLVPIKEKKFVVFISSYNNEKYVKKNLKSVFNQKYSNYRVIYVNDVSTDGTYSEVKKFLNSNVNFVSKFNLIQNDTNKGSIQNKYIYINKLCRNEEIIVNLDGDDFLFNRYVLKYLNYIYFKKKVLLTYGSYINTSGRLNFQKKINLPNTLRVLPSHLRSFYALCFKEIPKYYFTDDSGNFFQCCEDRSLMYPLMDAFGHGAKFVFPILYIYNDQNPININKVIKEKSRIEIKNQINNKKRLNKIYLQK